MTEQRQRSFGLDLARCAAGVMTLSVHFFLNSEFYTVPMSGGSMLLSVVVRMACMSCVPMFMLLTGYLCVTRRWGPGYYRRLAPILLTYVLSGLACVAFRVLWLGYEATAGSVAALLLDFSAAPYAWYIEMYIGLFLLSPFFNAGWHALDRRGKAALTISLAALTAVAPLLNMGVSVWPDWWESIYPLTYYAVGAQLRETPIRVKKRWLLLGWAATAASAGALSYATCKGGCFTWLNVFSWQSPFVLVQTTLLFSALRQCDGYKLPAPVRWCIGRIAKLSLAMYLVSYIADQLVYPRVNALMPAAHRRIFLMPAAVAAVAVCSLLLAQPIDWAAGALTRLIPEKKENAQES